MRARTPALSDGQARKLLETPDEQSLKGVRDRAILATLLYHGLRREELTKNPAERSAEPRRHAPPRHSRQGSKNPLYPAPSKGRQADQGLCRTEPVTKMIGTAPLFRPVRNNRTGTLEKPLHPDAIYRLVRRYALLADIPGSIDGVSAHCDARHRPPPNALQHQARHRQGPGMARPRPYRHPPGSTIGANPDPKTAPTFRVRY